MTSGGFQAGKAAGPGSALWYALLFTPEARRDAVAALLEVRAEIFESAQRPAEPAVAMARLQWWRGEIAGMTAGASQHPATRALREASIAGVVQPEYLQELVDAAESELRETPCRNFAELGLYCYRSSGVLHEMVAGVLGLAAPGNERQVRRYAQRLGMGIRLVEVIDQLGTDLAAGRRLLPRDWIAETGAREVATAHGGLDPALVSCLDRLAGEARLALDEAESVLPAAERARQRPGLVLAALYRRQLARLHAAGFSETGDAGNLAKLWTAWRAARRAGPAEA